MKCTANQNLVVIFPPNTKFSTTAQLICSASHSQHSKSHHATPFTFPTVCLASSLP